MPGDVESHDATHRLKGDTSPQNGCCTATKVPIWEPVAFSAVGFAAVADAGDLDGGLVFGIEEDSVVAHNGA